jgi:hypothetical protein
MSHGLSLPIAASRSLNEDLTWERASNVGNLAAMCEQHNMAKGDQKLLLWLLDRRAGFAAAGLDKVA